MSGIGEQGFGGRTGGQSAARSTGSTLLPKGLKGDDGV